MHQLRKQRDKTFDIFLKLSELEQKLEDKLPLKSTPKDSPSVKVELPSKESSYFYMTQTTTTTVDPEPKVTESQEERATTKPKPYGITYKVVSQAEKKWFETLKKPSNLQVFLKIKSIQIFQSL